MSPNCSSLKIVEYQFECECDLPLSAQVNSYLSSSRRITYVADGLLAYHHFINEYSARANGQAFLVIYFSEK